MGSTVGYRENKMRWGLQAVWMPALGLQGAEGRAGGHQQRRMPELVSVLCSWLFPVARFYLQILVKHLAPLWHSKTSRCLSARLPAQSSLLLHQPGRSGAAVGRGMSGWQSSTESSKAGGNPSSPVSSGKGLTASALSCPWGECAGEKCCRGRGITSCLIPHVCPTGES